MSDPSTSTTPNKRTRSSLPTQTSNDPGDGSAAGPSKKNKTSTSNSSSPPPTRTKSDRFYFSDGNIVLQVQDTDFKVHRGVLESQSSVFRDMFEVGEEGEDGQENSDRELPGSKRKDGVRSVELLQDYVGAWEVMLAALYEGVSFTLEQVSFDNLYGLLQLSDKYDFSSLLRLAQQLLVRESETLLGPSFDLTELEIDLLDDVEVTDVLRIIDLGKRFNVKAILPKAFYLLAKWNLDLDEASKEAEQDQSETGWLVQRLDKDDVSRILRIVQNGLKKQKSFQNSFYIWEAQYHDDACLEMDACRTSVSDEFHHRWCAKMDKSELDYRAILLLMIKDTWKGRCSCAQGVKQYLKDMLREYDESL